MSFTSHMVNLHQISKIPVCLLHRVIRDHLLQGLADVWQSEVTPNSNQDVASLLSKSQSSINFSNHSSAQNHAQVQQQGTAHEQQQKPTQANTPWYNQAPLSSSELKSASVPISTSASSKSASVLTAISTASDSNNSDLSPSHTASVNSKTNAATEAMTDAKTKSYVTDRDISSNQAQASNSPSQQGLKQELTRNLTQDLKLDPAAKMNNPRQSQNLNQTQRQNQSQSQCPSAPRQVVADLKALVEHSPNLGATHDSSLSFFPSCAVVTLKGEVTFDLMGNPYFVVQRPWYKRWMFWTKLSTLTFFYSTSKLDLCRASYEQVLAQAHLSNNYVSHTQKDSAATTEQAHTIFSTSFSSKSPSAHVPSESTAKTNLAQLLTLRRIYLNSKRIKLDKHWV